MKTLDELITENNWIKISQYKYLSEEFIEKYSDKLDWYCISQFQNLSEEFIDKYSDKVLWSNIVIYNILSQNFILKYINKINKHYVSHIKDINFNKHLNCNMCYKCCYYGFSLLYTSCDNAIMDRALL